MITLPSAVAPAAAVTFDDIPAMPPEVPGRRRASGQNRVIVVRPIREQPLPDVGEGHPYVLDLAPVVVAAGMGVSVDAIHPGVGHHPAVQEKI